MLFHRRKAEADMACGNAIARGPVPVLTLDVEDHRAFFPSEECRDHEADAFARTCRCEGENMLGACVFQVFKPIRFFIVPGADITPCFWSVRPDWRMSSSFAHRALP